MISSTNAMAQVPQIYQEHKFFSLRQKDHDPRFTSRSITLSKMLFHWFCFLLKTCKKIISLVPTLFQIVSFFLTASMYSKNLQKNSVSHKNSLSTFIHSRTDMRYLPSSSQLFLTSYMYPDSTIYTCTF